MAAVRCMFKAVLELQRCGSTLRNFSTTQNLLHTWKNDHRTFLHTSVLNFAQTVPFVLSDIGEGIVEVVVKEWYVKEGDVIAQFEPVCEVQSDKASVTITSRFDGRIGALHYDVDQIAKVGKPLLDIVVDNNDVSDETSIKDESVPSTKSSFTETLEESLKVFDKALATPAVRRIARENNVNLKDVCATGKGGRVLKEDILAFLATDAKKSLGIATHTSITTKTLPKADYVEEITGIRKAMVKTMTQAWSAPHFTYSDDVDVSALVKLRNDIQRLEIKQGVKITPLCFLLKATSLALLRFPKLNAEIDEACEKLTVRASHNLGVAIDSPVGLIVPNIKNVESLTVIEIARELGRLQLLAQQSKLNQTDLQGGTLTLSNIGAIGGTVATPVLLPPQIIIGAFGKFQKLPRFDESGNIVAVDIMSVSWSGDHRVVDGATVARFSNLFKLYVGSPRLLLEL